MSVWGNGVPKASLGICPQASVSVVPNALAHAFGVTGTIVAERYDEGGNGVAFQAPPVAQSVRKKDALRKNELGGHPEAVEVGGLLSANWITYEVEVAEAGDYEVELFMNRPDYFKTESGRTMKEREEAVHLNLMNAGSNPLFLANWKMNTLWDSGPRFRQPQISLGKQRVTLPVGRQKLLLSFGDITVPFTYFCKLVVTPAGG